MLLKGTSSNGEGTTEGDLKCLLVRPASAEKQKEKKEHIKHEIDLTGEIAKMSRKAKFIKRTLNAAYEGRSLNRKNILTLRNFFNNLEELLDNARTVIVCDILDSITSPRLLSEFNEGLREIR